TTITEFKAAIRAQRLLDGAERKSLARIRLGARVRPLNAAQ
ncbi:MAG: hypothetical protein ACI8PT_004663, partial [Gammaproteobacteria bacterium]